MHFVKASGAIMHEDRSAHSIACTHPRGALDTSMSAAALVYPKHSAAQLGPAQNIFFGMSIE